jgi:dTDP-glucose 4,6-dehydratase
LTPENEWRQGVAETVAWYVANREWWEPLKERAPVEETAWL